MQLVKYGVIQKRLHSCENSNQQSIDTTPLYFQMNSASAKIQILADEMMIRKVQCFLY